SGENHSIRIRSEDSPDIAGTFCYEASLHPDPRSARASAEQSLAEAGRAGHKHDWEKAFDNYADAARRFDGLRLRQSAAATRQAMAEIAYRRVYRLRESYALAVTAWADYQKTSPRPGEPGLNRIYLSLLAGLEAKDLIEAPGADVQIN